MSKKLTISILLSLMMCVACTNLPKTTAKINIRPPEELLMPCYVPFMPPMAFTRDAFIQRESYKSSLEDCSIKMNELLKWYDVAGDLTGAYLYHVQLKW